jgi:hypothetical protein
MRPPRALGAGDSSSMLDTSGQNFLRGYQISGVDAATGGSAVSGQVVFETIWPGWYTSRAIHIHVRVRVYDSSGLAVTNTTQMLFTDAANDHVLENAAPYNTGSPVDDPTTDENDTVLTSADDATNIVAVTGSIADGYAATFNITLDAGQSTTTNTSTTSTTSTTGTSPTTTSKRLHADLERLRWHFGKHGSRHLTAKLTTNETTTVKTEILRHGKRIAGARGHLTPGTHPMKVAVPAHVAAGAATLVVTATNTSGQTHKIKRQIHIPARHHTHA